MVKIDCNLRRGPYRLIWLLESMGLIFISFWLRLYFWVGGLRWLYTVSDSTHWKRWRMTWKGKLVLTYNAILKQFIVDWATLFYSSVEESARIYHSGFVDIAGRVVMTSLFDRVSNALISGLGCTSTHEDSKFRNDLKFLWRVKGGRQEHNPLGGLTFARLRIDSLDLRCAPHFITLRWSRGD